MVGAGLGKGGNSWDKGGDVRDYSYPLRVNMAMAAIHVVLSIYLFIQIQIVK
jgi:hypothetical protein